ncbi:DNA polymerase [Polyangium fumosum]|uniref:DNA polymerase n=1 Tax=Polyangium fumosum TaxID=889272 RepID=UPI0014795C77|nr:DNA polymerase [Polyangium fumosum]
MKLAHASTESNNGGERRLPFEPLHIQYLEERGVDPEWAGMGAGLRSVTPEEGAKLLGFTQPLSSGGLYIPYPNAQGYGRIRLDGGDTRFLVPAEREVPVYLPPGFHAKGPHPVYVVEGPIKALSLLDYHFNALGLGGTGTTLEKNARRLNDSWAGLELTGRDVFILFDSNRMTNPNVARDEARLAQALEGAGARVRVAALPPKPNGKDQGPDDFLAARGRAALQAIIDAAVPANPVERVRYISTHFSTNEERVRAATALLDDMPFLASIGERGVGVETGVADELSKYKVKPTVLKRALKEFEGKLKARRKHDAEVAPPMSKYVVQEGKFCILSGIGDTTRVEQLCNFTAHIEREEVVDDGAEQKRHLVVSGKLATGEPLPAGRVEAKDLDHGLWPIEQWGPDAIMYPVQRAPLHLLAAIQESSRWTRGYSFTHSGWREHNGEMMFLHANGGVGAADVSVCLEGELARYKLPAVAEDIPGAVKLALSFLELADPQITIPPFSAAFRAPLQHALYCDSTVSLCGPTGSMKTTLAALLMGFYGNFDAEHLPASWSWTVNRLEQMIFTAKDMLVAIDDFAPTKAEAGDELHRKAAQLLRAIGNANSRGRLRADLTARPDRPPRALVLSTGEDAPSGESIQARLITVRMKPGDVDRVRLTDLQKNRDRLPHAMLGYILWLKSQMNGLRSLMEKRFIELRAELHQEGQHLRAPAAMAHLLLGMEYFCLFAKDIGVLDENGSTVLMQKARTALRANAAEQCRAAVDVNPVHRFINVLRTLLVQGKVKTVDVGFALDTAEGKGIGWEDKDHYYLFPDAVYTAVVEAMRAAGQSMPLAQRMLWSRLVDDGFVLPGDEEGRSTRKKFVGGPNGQRERVLWFVREKLELRDAISERIDECAEEKNDEGDDDPDDGPGGRGAGGDGGSNQGGGSSGPQFGLPFPVIRSPEPAGVVSSGPGAAPRGPVPQNGTGRGTGPSSGSGETHETRQIPMVTGTDGELGMVDIPSGPEAPFAQGERLYSYVPQNDVGAGRADAESAYGPSLSPRACGASGPDEPNIAESLRFSRPEARPEAHPHRGAARYDAGPGDRDHFAGAILRAGRVGLVVHSTGSDITEGPVFVAVALPDGQARVFHTFGGEELGPVADALCQVTVVGHDLKRALAQFQYHLGFMLGTVVDTAIAWRLLNGGRHLENDKYFSFERACEHAFEKKTVQKNINGWMTPSRELRDELAQEARDVLRLADNFQKNLRKERLEEVAALEFKLLPIVAQMEVSGVPINRDQWNRLVDMWASEAAELKKNLVAMLGVKDLDHNDAILAALQRLGLQVERTNSEALAPYMHLPVAQQLVLYRRKNAFVTGAGKGVLRALSRSEDGRVHATFNQIGAVTGRLSAQEPNLLGLSSDNQVRSCIQAPPGKTLVVGDYNAIELRVLADQTGDEKLKEVFRKSDGDPHRHTASLLMGVPENLVTDEQRNRAKPVNFGGSFGMGVDKLITYAKKNYKVDLTREQAARFKQMFLQNHAGVAAWQKKMAEEMPAELRTRSGRVSYYFDPDEDYNARLAFPIQGTAADGMKHAMVLLAPPLERLGAQMILAVHDELLVEAPEEHAEEVKVLMRDCMIAGMQRYVPSVPILVEPKIMPRWSK